jgi:hypothetical protein
VRAPRSARICGDEGPFKLSDPPSTCNAAGAHFRSLRDPIDTSTPQGMFSMRRLADEGIIEASLLDRDRPQQNDGRLVRLVAGIKAGAPDRTLQQRTLQQIATRWHPSSVKHLLARAQRPGLDGTPRRMPRLGDEGNCGRHSSGLLSGRAPDQIKAHIVIAFLACCLHALRRRLHASAAAV